MGVVISFDSGQAAVEVQPGTQTACGITVQNTGMVVDGCLLDVLGPAREWARAEPERLNLLPGVSASARILFDPPRSAELAAGELPFALRAMSTEDPDGSRIEEGVLHVGEFGELAAKLVPQTATGRRAARYKVLVENRGNRPEQVEVTAADADLKLAFEAKPARFTAEPGTATVVRLRAVPRKTFVKGPDKTLPFEVSAGTERSEPVTVTGSMLEKQILPRWLLPVLGVAVLACGLVLALWFAVLKPAVQSAAQAGVNAANASASANAAAHPSPKPSTKPAPPANAVTVQLASPTVVTGNTDLASATGSFADGTNGVLPGQIVWTSSDPAVATVSSVGVVTSHSPGSATITATTTSTATSGGGVTAAVAHGATGPSANPAPSASASGSSSPGGGAAQPGVISGSATLNVVAPLAVSSSTLTQGAVGKPYSQPLAATGGTGTYTWSVSNGTLPAGLTLTPSTGLISGTPTTLGQSTFTVHVADAGPPTEFITRTLTLNVVNALNSNTTALPGGVIGAKYSQQLKAVGGTPPYTWALSPGAGALPDGLALDAATGIVSGTPTTTGNYSFTVKTTDSANPAQSTAQSYTITVVNPLIFITRTLPDAITDAQYSQTPAVTGGAQPYTWAVSAGTLPGGVVLNTATGLLSGTPTVTGTYTFTLKVSDASGLGLSATQQYTMSAVNGFSITTSSLPSAVVDGETTYAPGPLTAIGGTGPYVWQLTGTLPKGLTLTPDGQITGVPTTVGLFPFSIQATDSSSPPLTSTRSLTIAVVGSLNINTSELPAGVVGAGYDKTLSASGGAKGYTWTLIYGPLPYGLSLDASTGTISGTPTTTGSFPFTVRAVDSSTPSQATTMTLSITVVNPITFTLPALPTVVVGASYTAQAPTAAGGSGGYKWSISAGTSLPPGLVLDPKTGVISGAAAATDPPGTTSFILTATDLKFPTVSTSYPESMNSVIALSFSTANPPAAIIGVPYSFDLTTLISGGTAPYTMTAENVPGGLSISAAGMITGTPTSTIGAGYDLVVTDSSKPVPLTGRFTFTVSARWSTLTVSWVTSFPDDNSPTLFGSYSAPSVTGQPTTGEGPYSYSLYSGSLPTDPEGRSLGVNSANGNIEGVLASCTGVNSTWQFQVAVTSADGQTAVSPQLSMNCTTH